MRVMVEAHLVSRPRLFQFVDFSRNTFEKQNLAFFVIKKKKLNSASYGLFHTAGFLNPFQARFTANENHKDALIIGIIGYCRCAWCVQSAVVCSEGHHMKIRIIQHVRLSYCSMHGLL